MDSAKAGSFMPIYFRIQQHLRARVATGALKPGDRLPSESELAAAFETTRATVRHALERLVFEGMVTRKVGHGSFVAERRVDTPLDTTLWQSFEEQMNAQGSQVTFKLLRFERLTAPQKVATALAVKSLSDVYLLERLRFVDGSLIGLEIRYLVESIGEKLPDHGLRDTATQTLVEQVLGAPLGTIRVAIRAACADRHVARRLQVPAGSPLLIREHTFFTADEQPILHGEAIYREEFRFRYEIRGKRYQPGSTVSSRKRKKGNQS